MSETDLPKDLEFKTGEALLKGLCLSCLRTFSIFLTSSILDEDGLEELTEPASIGVEFSVAGRPTVLKIGLNTYPVRLVNSHKLLSSHFYDDTGERNVGESIGPYDPTLESLFGRAPLALGTLKLTYRV